MWKEQRRERFQQLRQRQQEGILTDVEQAELALLLEELEVAEAAFLTPATQRLRQEQETVEAQNRMLESLASRKEALVQRLRDFLTQTQAERSAIEDELAAVLAGGQGFETNGR